MIDGIIALLDEHNGAFTFLCTLAVAVFTGYLFRETRRLRKAATEPKLEVYLAINQLYPELVDMVVKNSGEGAAENIKWYLNLDEEDLDRREVPIHRMSFFNTLTRIPGKESFRFFFGSSIRLTEPPMMRPIKIHAIFQTEDGQKKQKLFTIDIEPFLGMMMIPDTSPVIRSRDALVSISNNLDQFLRSSKVPLVRALAEDQYQIREEQRKKTIKEKLESTKSKSKQ